MSPTSVKVTIEAVERAASMTVWEALVMEYRVCQRSVGPYSRCLSHCLALAFPLPFVDVSLPCVDLSHCLSLALHCLSWTFFLPFRCRSFGLSTAFVTAFH